MRLLRTGLLLAVFLVGQTLALGLMRMGNGSMTCCLAQSGQSGSSHRHCPPTTGTGNSCCADCPVFSAANVQSDAGPNVHVHRSAIATISIVDERALRRLEPPPVPPPRSWNDSAMGSTQIDHHFSSNI